MGTFCDLYINDYPVYSYKSQVDPTIMTLFKENDKKVYKRKCIDRNKIVWGHNDWDPNETEMVYEYTQTVKNILDRLDIMGYSLQSSILNFNQIKSEYLAELQSAEDENESIYSDEIEILKKSSFNDYLKAFKTIIKSGKSIHELYINQSNESKLIDKIVDRNEDFYWFFPCSDIRYFIRAILELVPDSAYVIQDITDLVHNGYYEESSNVCKISIEKITGNYAANSKIIIITEGITDSEIIKKSLTLLYPHLAEFYSFLDIELKTPGGAGSLLHLVKAFSAASIENRVIALFDNDTAGHSALKTLESIPLASNIKTLHYPDIDICKSYPTIGPTGESIQNINGMGASIELYYGRDVLTIDEKLVPIQWKSIDNRLKQYQGEILKKDFLKSRFLDKYKIALNDGTDINHENWNEMNAILKLIFSVFQENSNPVPVDINRVIYY